MQHNMIPDQIVTDLTQHIDLSGFCLYAWRRQSDWLYIGMTSQPRYRFSSHHIIRRKHFIEGDISYFKPRFNKVGFHPYILCKYCNREHLENSFNGFCNVICKRNFKKQQKVIKGVRI